MGITKVDNHYLMDMEDIKHAKKYGIAFGTHIGKGMFSDVFYAKYKSNKIALKASHKKKCSKTTLLSEIKVSNLLKNHCHENVVQFLETIDNHDNSQCWFLMAWVDGQDMYEIQSRMKAPFPESVAKDYFRQLVAGLQFLHSLNVVHRDIKPHNILIARRTDGQKGDVVKYIDFGFAKVVTVDKHNKALCDSHKGSQVYMAPELMSDKIMTYDAFKSDIYSLAIVLYEMLFNELPFGSSDLGIDKEERNDFMQKLKENLMIRYPRNSEVSESAKTLIENMICSKSHERYSLQQIIDSNWLKS